MKALVQRVTRASVSIRDDNTQQQVGAIARGLLLFLGIEKEDDQQVAQRLLDKVVNYRVFPDQSGRMNLGLCETGGELLIVSQFTLVANTQKGLRPSFSSTAPPDQSEYLYDYFVSQSRKVVPKVEVGQFGADMAVELVNDGPVTFLLNV